MAKQTAAQAARKPASYPSNWGSMTGAQKAQWREQNQGIKPTARTAAAPQQQQPAPRTDPTRYVEQDAGAQADNTNALVADQQQLGQQQPYAQQQAPMQQAPMQQQHHPGAPSVGDQLSAWLGGINLRSIAANLLRQIADAVEQGGDQGGDQGEGEF